MPLRLVYDGKTITDADLADRSYFIDKVITDVRGYLDPRIMEVLAAPVRNNTAAIDSRFQEKYPGVARVLVFRETSAPNECTAKFAFDADDGGAFLRLLVGKTTTVRMPTASRGDSAVAFVFPIGADGVVSRSPLIFVGTVGGNVRGVDEVYAAHAGYLASIAADEEYVPPTPAELAALKQAAQAGLAYTSGEFVPKAKYEAVAKRLAQMEGALDTLRRSFSFVNTLFEK